MNGETKELVTECKDQEISTNYYTATILKTQENVQMPGIRDYAGINLKPFSI